jgi:hypothetical protein
VTSALAGLPGGSLAGANTVFEQPWWLEAVAPGHWGEAVVRRDDDVVARLAFARHRRLGLTTLVQPPLTQTLGPWLAPIEGKYARRLETEKKVLGELIQALPAFDYLQLSLSTSLTNWLPFYWAGFSATVRYTYRIEDLSDLDRVQAEFQEQVRRGIKKASSALEVRDDLPLDELLRLDRQNFARQGLEPPYSEALVRRLDAACASRGVRRLFGAVDSEGRTHSALYVVWDEQTLYPIISARDPELQTFGANTLLYWEAIRLAATVSRVFDFEGSMLEPVEHFVRAFGGRQTPYFAISKSRRRARAALIGRSIAKGLVRRGRDLAAARSRRADRLPRADASS